MHSVRIVYISTYKDLVEGWALVLQLHLAFSSHLLLPCHFVLHTLLYFHPLIHQLLICLSISSFTYIPSPNVQHSLPLNLFSSFLLHAMPPSTLGPHAILLFLLLNSSTSSSYTDGYPSFKLGKVAPNIHRHQY